MLNAMVAQDYVKIYRDLHYDLFILSNRMRRKASLDPPKKVRLNVKSIALGNSFHVSSATYGNTA